MPMAEHRAFLRRECFALTLGATAQRAHLYQSGTSEALRRAFQASLRTLLEDIAESYRTPVGEDAHVASLERVASALSKKHADVLADGRFRIGTAQKALNLYLKYLWCLGEVPEPPHCPIDAVVLRHVPACKDVRWTRIDSIEEYRRIIGCAKIAAKGVSLAQWELVLYSAARNTEHPKRS